MTIIGNPIIRLMRDDEANNQFCSVCKHREKFEPENKPIVKIIGDSNCTYCGGEINLCRGHLLIFKEDLAKIK